MTTLPAVWKPIESAPKDGTPVLLFARLVDAEASTRVIGAYLSTFGWLAQSYSHQTVAQVVPSHWMELPPFPGTPPASAQDAPITVSLDPDPRGVSVGVWQGSCCIYNGAHAVPSAQDDARKEAVMDAIASALGDAYDCTRVWAAWGIGTMSEDDFRLITNDADRLGELADAAIAAMRPAAGDARALLDHPLLREVLGYIEDAGPADVWGAAQSWMALRDAASQQQEG